MAGYRIMIFAAFAAALLAFVAGTGTLCRARQATVGMDVAMGDVTDFYYTYSSSTYPPHYQRYRFFLDGGKRMFYHETREGGGWPQTEKDITASGSRALSDAEWTEFYGCVKGGTVRDREEHLEDGGAGPWLFLYWKGDRGTCQEFSFPSASARTAFEDLCARLKKAQQDRTRPGTPRL